MIVRHPPGAATVADKELEQAKIMLDALSISVAQRTIRLW